MRCGNRSTAGSRRPEMALNGILRTLGLPAILMMVPVCCVLSQAAPEENSQDPEYRLSVDVNLVVLHATVRDRQGGFAADLREQDFEVYEDGVPQHIRRSE